MTEMQDGGFTGQWTSELQPHEPPHRIRLVEQVLHTRGDEVVEQLHAVNSRHGRQRVGVTAPSGLGVEGTGPLLEALLGNQALHALQELFPASLALLALVLQAGERRLVHLISSLTQIEAASHTMPDQLQLVQSILHEDAIKCRRCWESDSSTDATSQ